MAGQVQVNELLILIWGTASMLMMLVAIIVFSLLFQKKLIKKERAFRDIEKLLQKQEITSAYNLIQSQEEERKRIASDVHDNLGSLLATLKIYSDLVLRGHEEEGGIEKIHQKMNSLIETATNEVRKISHSLDSSTLRNFGLSAAIEQLCEAIAASGKVKLTYIVDIASPPDDGETLLHLYRIVQELFTNTLKHAQASDVRFEITQAKDEITIIHEDNGVGFEVEEATKKSMGLNNIQLRVKKLRGELKIQSSPQGSTFIVEIPANPKYDL